MNKNTNAGEIMMSALGINEHGRNCKKSACDFLGFWSITLRIFRVEKQGIFSERISKLGIEEHSGGESEALIRQI